MERDRCEQELHVCKYGGIHKVEDYVFLQRMSAVCFLLAFLSAAHAVILFFRLDIGGITAGLFFYFCFWDYRRSCLPSLYGGLSL